jgi:hypothetical protein
MLLAPFSRQVSLFCTLAIALPDYLVHRLSCVEKSGQCGLEFWVRRSDPALKFAADDGLDHFHAAIAVVEAGNVGELLAAILVEDLACFAGDFLKRFKAIGDEARD